MIVLLYNTLDLFAGGFKVISVGLSGEPAYHSVP